MAVAASVNAADVLAYDGGVGLEPAQGRHELFRTLPAPDVHQCPVREASGHLDRPVVAQLSSRSSWVCSVHSI